MDSNAVECESEKAQEAVEVRNKKKELKGTKLMAVKNCMNTDIVVDGKHGSVTIKPGKYESFEPSSSVLLNFYRAL